MKTISIKTVDGNRYEYNADTMSVPVDDWYIIKDDKTLTTRWFYVPNIVSISVKPEANDG